MLWQGTRAKLLAQLNRPSQARALVDNCVALAAGTDFLMLHADASRDRADVLMILGRPEQAVPDLESAIALDERKGIVVRTRAGPRSG